MTISSLQWLSLVGTIWLQSITGTNFNFSAYSSQLKSLLSMSQLQLSNLSFASDTGKLFGWFSGIAALHLPLWLVLLLGSFLGLLGYGVQFLFITDHASTSSYWQVFLLSTLAGNSICWINTVCYLVAITNFPAHRQLAVGLSTSYQGLSAKIYTAMVDAVVEQVKPRSAETLPKERARAYLFLSSFLPLLVCIVTAPFVRKIQNIKNEGKGSRRKREGGFLVMFGITVGTGIFAVFSSFGRLSKDLSPLRIAIGLGVFLSAPLVVPLAAKVREMVLGQKKWANSVHVVDHEVGEEEKNIGVVEVAKLEGGGGGDMGGGGIGEEVGVKEMLRRVEFWLYFFVYLFGATVGYVYLNSLGQIAESRGFSRTATLVAFSSSFRFFGRLMPSLLDYFYARNEYLIVRPAAMAVMMAPMSAALFLLVHESHVALYISTAIIGVTTGAITSTAVSVTTELFGTKNFSINHNVLVANIPMGSFVFGSLAALVYRQVGRRGGVEDGSRCMGAECYRSTFIAWGSLCFLGTFLAFILYSRTRKLYHSQRL